MGVLRFKAINLSNKNEIKEVDDSYLLTKAYLETAIDILNSGRTEKIRMADLVDLVDSYMRSIDKDFLVRIEKEISDLKLINGNYSRTILLN